MTSKILRVKQFRNQNRRCYYFIEKVNNNIFYFSFQKCLIFWLFYLLLEMFETAPTDLAGISVCYSNVYDNGNYFSLFFTLFD